MESGAAGPLEPHLAKARPVSVREKPAAPATVSADAQTGTYDHEQSEQNFLRLPMEWLMLLWELELSLVAFARAVLRRLDAALRSAAQVCDQWRSMSGSELRTGERITLEIGFVIILVALSAGLELGRWPAWSGLAALVGYLAWTVLYSEATIQATRRQLGGNRPLKALSADPAVSPG